MSRSTAEIVADLRALAHPMKGLARGFHNAQQTLNEAADRLTELDVTRPRCPTCRGTTTVTHDRIDNDPLMTTACPDCVDGKVSVEQLAATWRAVHAAGKDSALIPVIGVARFATPEHHGASVMLDHLRQVRP